MAHSLRPAAVVALLMMAGPVLHAAESKPSDTTSAATECDSYGKNFYALPHSGVCVAAGAIAELTGQTNQLSGGLRQQQLVFHGALAGDIRTQTGWGELRGFTRVSYYSDSHSWNADYLFISMTGSEGGVAQIGLSDSTFNYLGGGPSVGVLRSANLSAKLIRLSHKLTPSLTAKFSLEVDPTERPRSVADPIANITPNAIPSITTTDRSVPDFVGALSYDPKEGSAQLSGVVHRVQSPDPRLSDKTGFAVQFGMTLPLNFDPPDKKDDAASDDDADDDSDDDTDDDSDDDTDTANKDDKSAPAVTVKPPWDITHSFAWQVAYAQGATLYLGYGTGRFSKAAVDAVVVPGGGLELISGVSAMAYYTIGWIPKVTQNIFGSWSQLSPPSAAIGFNLLGSRDYQEARIGTNLVYEPWKDFTITLEAMAMKVDLTTIRNGTATQLANGTTAYQFSLQVSKTF